MGMRRTYTGLYEEPTSYRYEYIKYSEKPQKQSQAKREILLSLPQEDECSVPVINTITANDTFQKLSYQKRLPFNALWEPKDSISRRIKPALRKQILGDPHLDEVIKTRPRVYMTPAVCVDNVTEKSTRQKMVNYTYQTPWHIACKEAWMDFEPRHPCTAYTAIEKCAEMLSKKKVKTNLPLGFPSVAREWDRVNARVFTPSISEHDDSEHRKTKCNCDILLTLDEEQEIRKLIDKNEISLPYDKFPLSYGGFRPKVALGVPLKKTDAFTF